MHSAETVLQGSSEKEDAPSLLLPIVEDRACHDSAEQTRAACQHLICWRLGNYYNTVAVQKYHWTPGDVKWRSSLRFCCVWKPKLYQSKNCKDCLSHINSAPWPNGLAQHQPPLNSGITYIQNKAELAHFLCDQKQCRDELFLLFVLTAGRGGC